MTRAGGTIPLGVMAVVLVGLGASDGHARAMHLGGAEVTLTPYGKLGTLAWDQLEGVGGHKFLAAGGLGANIVGERLGASCTLEGWSLAEGLDDDRGNIPENGLFVEADMQYVLYKNTPLHGYLYAGCGYAEWHRPAAEDSWRDVAQLYWNVGLGVRHDKGGIRIGMLCPFATSTSATFEAGPRFGFVAEGRVTLHGPWSLGLFYRYEGLEFQRNGREYPDAKMTQSGLFVQYVF